MRSFYLTIYCNSAISILDFERVYGMTSISPIKSLELPIPPSCVAFSQEHPDYFVVGTYLLEKDAHGESSGDPAETIAPQQRSGSLILYRIDGDEMYVLSIQYISFSLFKIFVFLLCDLSALSSFVTTLLRSPCDSLSIKCD